MTPSVPLNQEYVRIGFDKLAGIPMTNSPVPITERRYVVPLIMVPSLFFLWALGVNLNDILIPHLKKAFGLSDFRSSLIRTAFCGRYFLAALPAGWLISLRGYQPVGAPRTE